MISSRPPLVGRDPELREVRRFLARAAATGAALVVTGPAGIGRSLLLETAADIATADGVCVLRARGVQLEADVPFAALHQILLPLLPSLTALDARHRAVLSIALGLSGGAPSPPPAVAEAVTTALRAASSRRPVLLAVDDLQLVDRPSAATLDLIAQQPAGTRVGLLATAAGEPSTRVATGWPALVLGRLDPGATVALARSRFPDLAPDVADAVAARAQGNPLALVEWAGALSEAERTGAVPLRSPMPMTPRLHALFAPQIASASASTRRSLVLAALAHERDRAAVGASLRTADLVAAQSAQLLRVDERSGRVEFPHPVIEATVVALSTGAQRRDAHRELARLAGAPERRAWHRAEAAPEPDAAVAGALEHAATSMLRRGDWAAAVAALLRSGELTPDPADAARRWTRAAYVQATVGGQLDAAAQVLARARRLDPQAGRLPGAVAADAHIALHRDGDVDPARRLPTGTGATGHRAVGEDGDDSIASWAWPERSDNADTARLERIVRRARSARADGLALRAVVALASACVAGGRWTEAARWTDAGLELCAATGHRLWAQQLRLLTARIDAVTGNPDHARAVALDVDAWAAPRQLRMLQAHSACVRMLAAATEGDFELVYHQASAIRRAGTPGPESARALWVGLDLVEAAVRTGRREQAVAHVDALLAIRAPSPCLAMVVTACAAMVATGERMRGLFDEALTRPGLDQRPFELARVRLIYGERLRRMRAPAEARPLLVAAADAFARMGAGPWQARAVKELSATGVSLAGGRDLTLAPLTPKEHEVAMLAATGLSNRRIAERLFVSHRTVGAHLRQVFPKLGVASRAALRDALEGDLVSA